MELPDGISREDDARIETQRSEETMEEMCDETKTPIRRHIVHITGRLSDRSNVNKVRRRVGPDGQLIEDMVSCGASWPIFY